MTSLEDIFGGSLNAEVLYESGRERFSESATMKC